MNKQQKYLKKRKEREAKALEQRLQRGKKASSEYQKNREQYLEQKMFNRQQRLEARLAVAKNIDVAAHEIFEKLPENTKDKIQKNIEILQALEDEYKAEMETKKKLNQQLEAAGHITFEEKIQALSDKNPTETPELSKMLEKTEE